MNSYRTLLGHSVHLTLLVPLDHRLVCRLIALADGPGGQDAALNYSRNARDLLQAHYSSRAEYDAVVCGPVGDIYRDGFYRLILRSLSGRDREELRQRVLFSPLRLLLDRYLDGWRHQGAYAEEAGVSPSTLSRIFSYLLRGKKSGQLSLGRFEEAFRRLAIVPQLGSSGLDARALLSERRPLSLKVDEAVDQRTTDSQEESPIEFSKLSPTVRERQLWPLLASMAKLWASPTSLKDIRATLGFNLALIYGISDIVYLTEVTDRVLGQLAKAPQGLELAGAQPSSPSGLGVKSQGVDRKPTELLNLWADGQVDFLTWKSPVNPRDGSDSPPLPSERNAAQETPSPEERRLLTTEFVRRYDQARAMVECWFGSPQFDFSLEQLEHRLYSPPCKPKCYVVRAFKEAPDVDVRAPRSHWFAEATRYLAWEERDSCNVCSGGDGQKALRRAIESRYLDETYCASLLRGELCAPLLDTVESMDSSLDDVERFAELDFEFHRLILVLAGYCWKVPGLRAAFLIINSLLSNAMGERARREEIVREHREILNAIEKQNIVAVGRAFIKHFVAATINRLDGDLAIAPVRSDLFGELMRISNDLTGSFELSDIDDAHRSMSKDDLLVWFGIGTDPLEVMEMELAGDEAPPPSLLDSLITAVRSGAHFLYVFGDGETIKHWTTAGVAAKRAPDLQRFRDRLATFVAKPSEYLREHIVGWPTNLIGAPFSPGESYALVFFPSSPGKNRITCRLSIGGREPESCIRTIGRATPKYIALGHYMTSQLCRANLSGALKRKVDQAWRQFQCDHTLVSGPAHSGVS